MSKHTRRPFGSPNRVRAASLRAAAFRPRTRATLPCMHLPASDAVAGWLHVEERGQARALLRRFWREVRAQARRFQAESQCVKLESRALPA